MPRLKMTIETPSNAAWRWPILSPDGTKIAFSAADGLRVRATDSLDSHLVADAETGGRQFRGRRYDPAWLV
jgi:hypothetical protein